MTLPIELARLRLMEADKAETKIVVRMVGIKPDF